MIQIPSSPFLNYSYKEFKGILKSYNSELEVINNNNENFSMEDIKIITNILDESMTFIKVLVNSSHYEEACDLIINNDNTLVLLTNSFKKQLKNNEKLKNEISYCDILKLKLYENKAEALIHMLLFKKYDKIERTTILNKNSSINTGNTDKIINIINEIVEISKTFSITDVFLGKFCVFLSGIEFLKGNIKTSEVILKESLSSLENSLIIRKDTIKERALLVNNILKIVGFLIEISKYNNNKSQMLSYYEKAYYIYIGMTMSTNEKYDYQEINRELNKIKSLLENEKSNNTYNNYNNSILNMSKYNTSGSIVSSCISGNGNNSKFKYNINVTNTYEPYMIEVIYKNNQSKSIYLNKKILCKILNHKGEDKNINDFLYSENVVWKIINSLIDNYKFKFSNRINEAIIN